MVSRQFVDDFNLVHEAFRTPPEDVELAKEIARADMAAAEEGYSHAAQLIRGGWRPCP